jgi:hypothetical protein
MLTEEQKRIFLVIGSIIMFLAGFAAADQLLFNGATTPGPVKFLAGWIVCLGAGFYLAALFRRAND